MYRKTTVPSVKPLKPKVKPKTSHFPIILFHIISNNCRYKIEVSGKSLPVMTNQDKGKYGVIVFENVAKYLEMDKWNRELLDKYCREYSVGIVAFFPPTETPRFDEPVRGFPLSRHSNMKLKDAGLNSLSPILRLTRAGETAWGDLPGDDWSVFLTNHSTYETLEFAFNQSERHIVLPQSGEEFGSGNQTFYSTVIQALLRTQKRIQKLVRGFKFNLGFSGKYFHHGESEENAGDDLLLENAHEFTWFSHMWNHQQPHLYENQTQLEVDMMLNKQFAKINIFMSHMGNYGNDRLALYTFESVIKFITCWTNLHLSSAPPMRIAEKYFQLYPEEQDPIWGNPCLDNRHVKIWSHNKSCDQLPRFLVIGPQKTGTTALYTFLSLHPNISSNSPSPASRYYLSYNTALVKLLKKLGIRSVPRCVLESLNLTQELDVSEEAA
ncbi:bifunctional heparan sulfate N-deacetylase/N-sulfotransferase-like [Diaphorina citri]|uniref:Bifunctional heparan sulfate N-deacetylase/N-sulfotransferase-like n=1 Tax=Diaphorina citri TaxID=121845 RepID=A0A3Q0IJW4_DIACI|nr:bifunctional heparan sulfate N-deacetylase/N-sulfotransferase-like [Diaphorina citri]